MRNKLFIPLIRKHYPKAILWASISIMLIIVLLYVFGTGPFQKFQTSVLRTSLSKLSSTVVDISIPEKGKLVIKAGPSQYLQDARIFAMVMSVRSATLKDGKKPFLIDSSHQIIFNSTSPNDNSKLILAVLFPQDYFLNKKNLIAEVPFSTVEAGEFAVESIYFGSLPSLSFPPWQEYPIFIESAIIPFDEKGAAAKGGRVIAPPPKPISQQPVCADAFDNDGDKKIDADDPGCFDEKGKYLSTKDDETDPPPLLPLELNIPKQYLKTIKTPDGRTDFTVILPPAQEQIRYEYVLKASSGKGAVAFGVRGRTPNANQVYPMTNSGLVLKTSGLLSGEATALKSANYWYPLFVTDGTDTINFSIQFSVYDGFGKPVVLILDTSFFGTEHRCLINQVCEAFFRASKGIEPYIYSFSGESPTGEPILQPNSGQAFYRFTPLEKQIGTYQITVSVRDSSQTIETEKPKPPLAAPASTTTAETSSPTTTASSATHSAPPSLPAAPALASITFNLIIEKPTPPPPPPPPLSSFKMAAKEPEKICEFLDVSPSEERYVFFQFTCKNNLMDGLNGMMRPEDSLNRAEAAKITTLIESGLEKAKTDFAPFQDQPVSTPVNFKDITVGDWYSVFVYHLFREGMVINKPLYRPADSLTIAEAMKLIVEAYASLNVDVARELEAIINQGKWYTPYQMIAQYVKASVAKQNPAQPIQRQEVAELLYKLWIVYPIGKFK